MKRKEGLFAFVVGLVALVYLAMALFSDAHPAGGVTRAVISVEAVAGMPCRVASYVAVAPSAAPPRGCQELVSGGKTVEQVGSCYFFRALERDFRIVMDHAVQALHTYDVVLYVGEGQTPSAEFLREFCAAESAHSYHAEEGKWSAAEEEDLAEASRLLKIPHTGHFTSPFYDSGSEIQQLASLAYDLHSDLATIFAKRPKSLKKIDKYAIQLAAAELEKKKEK